MDKERWKMQEDESEPGTPMRRAKQPPIMPAWMASNALKGFAATVFALMALWMLWRSLQ